MLGVRTWTFLFAGHDAAHNSSPESNTAVFSAWNDSPSNLSMASFLSMVPASMSSSHIKSKVTPHQNVPFPWPHTSCLTSSISQLVSIILSGLIFFLLLTDVFIPPPSLCPSPLYPFPFLLLAWFSSCTFHFLKESCAQCVLLCLSVEHDLWKEQGPCFFIITVALAPTIVS